MKQLSILFAILFACVSLCACNVKYGDEGREIKVEGDEVPIPSEGGVIELKFKPYGWMPPYIQQYPSDSREDKSNRHTYIAWEGKGKTTKDGPHRVVVTSPDGKEQLIGESDDSKKWTLVIPPNTSTKGRTFFICFAVLEDFGGCAYIFQEGTKLQ